MNRTWKQISFGSVYLLILVLIIAGIYFLYLKPTPSCTDNKQNQKETGIDCGGDCIPCEVKNLSVVTEELKILPAGKDQSTLLTKVSNPSQNFTAKFSYEFNLRGTLLQPRELKGKTTLAPKATKYIVVPGLPISGENIRSANLNVSGLNWSEDKRTPLNIRVKSSTSIDKAKITVVGVLSNDSAVNLPPVRLTALLFDKTGEIVSASFTELENIEAFSVKQFTVFFPEIGKFTEINPERTEVQWELSDESP